MLRELSIQDFVIVRELSLTFEKGLSVLTGETGAGKSILVDALGLILGARANASVVRPGAKRAQVTAVFDSPPDILRWLAEFDLDQEDELVLRRVIDNQGKGRAYINGTPSTMTQLRDLGQLLIDIHGQHAHQGLLKPENQRDMLDAFASLMPLRNQVNEHWRQWQAAHNSLENALRDQATIESQKETLTHQIEELQALAPEKNEWQQISEMQARLSNGQALLEGAQFALQALEDDESGAQKLVNQAFMHISALVRHDPSLVNVSQSLESASIALNEVRSDLSRYLDTIDLDAHSLEQTEARMRALFDAARRHRCEPEDLPQTLAGYQTQLDQLEQDQDIEALQARLAQRQAAYDADAERLRAQRHKAAAGLSKSVTDLIRELGMPEGRFIIDVEPVQAGVNGIDRIVLKVASHEQATPAPMRKVASGGELSRISLALSVLASQANEVPTLIFDEIDVGVSGAVAEKIGELLRQLGGQFQVLCVTHLPQVASCAHQHFLVSKQKDAQGVYSQVHTLNTLEQRIEAMASLLGGAKITQTTRKHAREMLSRFDSR